jgi:hypothetical protein
MEFRPTTVKEHDMYGITKHVESSAPSAFVSTMKCMTRYLCVKSTTTTSSGWMKIAVEAYVKYDGRGSD